MGMNTTSLALVLWMPGSLLLLPGIFRRKLPSRTRRGTWFLGIFLLALAATGSSTGCGGASSDAVPGTYPISVALTLSGGSTQQISATVTVQ